MPTFGASTRAEEITMDTAAETSVPTTNVTDDRIARGLALAGVGYGVLTFIGYLTIGDFPDGSTSPPELVRYYADHHAAVASGGKLLEVAAVCSALFGVALFLMVRRGRHGQALGAIVLIGAAMDALTNGTAAATYSELGSMSTYPHLDPAALQSWHIIGADFGVSTGTALLLLGVAAAGIVARSVPAWLAIPAFVLGVGLFAPSPLGFFTSLLILLWSVVAGTALAVRRNPA
jgi:hypothetical protein